MARLDLFEKWVEDGTAESNLAIIQSLSMQGMTLAQIASHFNITERQICRLQKKHTSVKSAIKNGRENVIAMAQSKLMDRVKAGDIAAIIYTLKVYGGEFFNDKKFAQKSEITGKNGEPIEVKPGVSFYLPEKEEI